MGLNVSNVSCCWRREEEQLREPHSPSIGRCTVCRKARISDKYQLGARLGKGGYGEVREAIHKPSGKLRAVKVIGNDKQSTARKAQELDIMWSLDHPNTVKLFEVFQDVTTTFVVMEHCAGGDVFDWCDKRLKTSSPPTEKQASLVLKHILKGVNYMHQNWICHRDLKPENFLLSGVGPIEDNIVKICDFGVSCRCTPQDVLQDRIFSGYYVAPEVLEGSYHLECDMWSVGVCMFILLTGTPPFTGRSEQAMRRQVLQGHYVLKDDMMSPEAREVQKGLLVLDPQRRLSASQALEKRWFELNVAADRPLRTDLPERLRAFRRFNKLKKIALQIIARHAEDEEIQELRQTFMALDKDGDGILSKEEVKTGFARHSPNGRRDTRRVTRIPSNFEMEDLFEKSSSDDNGHIKYNAFLAAMLSSRQDGHSDMDIRHAFNAIDKNGSGSICMSEIREVFRDFTSAGESEFTEDEIMEVMEAVDKDNDGEIDFEEFSAMMMEPTPKAAAGQLPIE